MTFTIVIDMNVHVMHNQGMKLDIYLDQNGISDAAFATAIGVSRSMVTKLRHRTTRPSAETAISIERATMGAVMLADLMAVDAHPAQSVAAE